MVDILRQFEQAARDLNPVALIAPGVAAIVLGLVLWLGGLIFRRVLSAILGICIGAAAGWILGGQALWVIAGAAAAALVGVAFKRVFAAGLAALLAGSVTFLILAQPPIIMIVDAPHPSSADPADPANPQRLTVAQSLDLVRACGLDLVDAARSAGRSMPARDWIEAAFLAGAFAAVAFFLWRAALAVSFSAWGTALVFAGMAWLALLKGAEPVSRISQRPSFYGMVFLAMAAFGTAEQLLLGRPRRPADKQIQPDSQKLQFDKSWRNR